MIDNLFYVNIFINRLFIARHPTEMAILGTLRETTSCDERKGISLAVTRLFSHSNSAYCYGSVVEGRFGIYRM